MLIKTPIAIVHLHKLYVCMSVQIIAGTAKACTQIQQVVYKYLHIIRVQLLSQLLGTGPSGTDLTGLARFQAATVAGMASSLIATPSELIIIQQQVRSCVHGCRTMSSLWWHHTRKVLAAAEQT
jgi:hypothetical protein